jgi:ectoine hydroxylase-related dioxygenase (phytanoyl-CoA dioxygenase family)
MPAITAKAPLMDEQYQLPAELIKHFRNDGFVLVPSLATDEEIAWFRPAISNAVRRLNTESRNINERDTYGKAFLQIMNIWKQDEEVKRFTLAVKFAKVAAALLGVDKVRLYHDQALFKEPGGGPTPWHQDQYYWPLDTPHTITMWMPLVDIDEEMGMLTFAKGSNKDGLVKNVAISDESEHELDEHVRKKNYDVIMPRSMKAGDATFHYGYTLHKAPGNSSDKMREVMTIIYFADGAKVTAPVNDAQEKDRQVWLEGLPPGSMAASALNPLIG